MELAALILVVAALGGIYLASVRIRKHKNPKMWLALGHGGLAVIGLGILIYAWFQATGALSLASIAFFIVAAIFGLTMFSLFHLRRRVIPKSALYSHGVFALTGLALLLATIILR